MRGVLLSVVLLPAAFLATGCSDDDSVTPSGTVTTDTGASTTTSVATMDIDPATGLPRSFPEDFPVIEGATVARASEYSDRYVIEWRSAAAHDTAAAFYDEALGTAPWQVDSVSEDGAATTFEISRGPDADYAGTLAVAELDEGSRILLELHPPEER